MLRILIGTDDEMFGGALTAALLAVEDITDAKVVEPNNLTSTAVGDGRQGTVVVLHGGEAVKQTGAMAATAPVLVLGPDDSLSMIAAVDSGAMGYLRENSPLDVITEAVVSLGKGVAQVDPTMLGALLRHVVERRRTQAQARSTLQVLTPREDQVFRLLARGYDNDRVAESLYISSQTVRTHTRRIMEKLDLHSRSELVALAARCGLDLSPEREPDG